MPVFDQEKVDRIKKIIKWYPRGITISDLATKMEMNRNLVAKYLDILLVAGQVDMQVIGAAKVYFLTNRVPITSILEYSTDMVIILDLEKNIIHVNEPLLLQVNERRENLVGRNLRNLDHPFLKALPVTITSKDTESVKEEASEIECTVRGKKHHYKVKQLQTAFEDGSRGITLIIEDITDQITYQEMLEINEAQYRGIVEDQTEFITRLLPEETLVFVNEAYARYLSKNKADLLGGPLIPDIDDDDTAVMNTCIRSLDFLNPVKSFECRIHHSSGHDRWNLWTVRALFDDNRKLIEYQCVGRDNTEKREAATRINHYIRDLEFLARKSQEFVEISNEDEIFLSIAQGISEILPDSLITVNSVDMASDTLTIRSVLPDKDKELLLKYLGKDLQGFTLNIGLLPEEQKKLFSRAISAGKLLQVEENLSEIFFQQVPQDTCDKIRQELDLGNKLYTIGLARHGIIFGNVSFSPRKGESGINSSIIETFIHQASVVLHRRRTEDTLKASEKLYRSVIENIQDVFYRSDTKGTLIMASSSWAQMLGYDSLDSCIGYGIAEKFYFEPEKRKKFLEDIEKHGSVKDYDVILKRKDGSPVHVSTNSHQYYDTEGNLLGIEGTFRDISERYAAEKKMREQLEQMDFFSRKLQDFIELSPESDIFHAIGAGFHEILPGTAIAVNSFDPASKTFMVRAIFSESDHEIINKIMGKEVIGMRVPFIDGELANNAITGKVYPLQKTHFEILIRPLAPDTFASIENSLSTAKIYSVGLIWHDMLLGTIIFALKNQDTLTNISLIETFARAASIALHRKSADDALRESEEIFSSVAQFAPLPIAIIAPDGTYRYINKKFTETFGYDFNDFRTGKEWFSLAYPDPVYRQKVIDTWNSDLETFKSGVERPRRFSVRCKNGVDREIVFRPVTLANKKQFVIYEEIPKEQKSERLEKPLSLIVETTSDAIIEEKPDGTIVRWNGGATHLFGYTANEAVGHNISLIIPQDQQEESHRLRNRIMNGETVKNHKTRRMRKNGTVIDAEVTLSPITDENGIITAQSTIARKVSCENLKEQQNAELEHHEISDDNRIGEGITDTGKGGAGVPVIKTTGIGHPFHLSHALKMARDYIAIIDRTGKCVWVNDSFVSAVNAANENDLEGKSIALFIAPEFRKIALDSLMEIKKSGNKTVQLMILSSSGRLPVEANISAINTENGDLFGYMAIARQVERAKVEKLHY